MEAIQNKKKLDIWPYAIIIVLVLFMSYIVQFVYRSTLYPTDLVTEDYYQQEMTFQAKIEKSSNALSIKDQMSFEIQDGLIAVAFPKEWKKISGTLSLYNPMNKKLDVSMPFTTQDNVLKMKLKDLQVGKWIIKLDFDYNGKGYFVEEKTIIR